jgi:hypothetical protein
MEPHDDKPPLSYRSPGESYMTPSCTAMYFFTAIQIKLISSYSFILKAFEFAESFSKLFSLLLDNMSLGAAPKAFESQEGSVLPNFATAKHVSYE